MIDTSRLFSPVVPSNTFTPWRSEASFTAYGILIGESASVSGSKIDNRNSYVPRGGGASVTETWLVVPGAQLLVSPFDRG
jgi:hypothetical protein